MKYRIITYKEMCKILLKHGYHIDGYRGSHAIFVKEGHNPVSVNNRLNPIVAQRLIKENNLGGK